MTKPENYELLADILLPGRAPDWPAASDVLDRDALATALAPLADFAEALVRLPAPERKNAVRTREIRDPGPFGAALGALTDAYYATPTVAARCAALAEGGPRPESGQWFDPSMLAARRV